MAAGGNIDPRKTAFGGNHVSGALEAPRGHLIANPKARLLDQFREVCRFKHMSARTPALASSVISLLPPLPCLAVGAATNSVARSNRVFMFCIRHRMNLGPLCTPVVV
jgi:hypothetical protein